MKTIHVPHPLRSFGAALAIAGLQFSSAVLPSAYADDQEGKAKAKFFDWENLVSDIPGVADRTDEHLVNPWGLVINPGAGIFWVADNGTGFSTLYRPDGTIVPLVVTIPPTAADTQTPPHAKPTGIVFNPFAQMLPNAFPLSNDKPAVFIFDGEDGSITAWNGGTSAEIEVDNSSNESIYKGLALAVRKNGEPTLYAANFHNGTVDIFDSKFKPVTITGSFVDPNLPPVPKNASGWAPFNIASIDGHLYVTFAAQDADKEDDVAGAGFGFVDVFDTEGHYLRRLITGGELNAPWGLAKVPGHFGRFDDEILLVGNFGDGNINAYDVRTGGFRGKLLHRTGQPLEFNGLWALFFFHDHLYFTAGIADEEHGLFGFIHPTEKEKSDD
jgi:uncharacterized protein (TIGR03118 family)